MLQDVLTLVLDSALDISRAQRGFIMLADAKGKLNFRLARARAGQTLSDVTFETSRKIPEEVFRTGQTRVVRDLFQLGVKDDHSATTELGIRHVVCVPLNLVQYMESMEYAPRIGGSASCTWTATKRAPSCRRPHDRRSRRWPARPQ